MQPVAGAERDALYHGIPVFGIEPPTRSRAAPVADILAVQRHTVRKAHLIAHHAPRQLQLVAQRQPGQAVAPGCKQTVAQRIGLGLVKMLLRFKQDTDCVIYGQRRVRKRRPAAFVQGRHKHIVFVKIHPLGVGKHIDRADLPGRIVTDVHRGADRQHRLLPALRCVDGRRQLGIAEAVQHAVIADAVPGAEILVGGIIKHTPAKTARMLSICVGGVQHPRMAQGMLLPVRGIVTGLGGVHVAVAF